MLGMAKGSHEEGDLARKLGSRFSSSEGNTLAAENDTVSYGFSQARNTWSEAKEYK